MTDLGDAWLWIAPAVGFLVHLTVGRQNPARVARQWEQLPTALDPGRLGQIRAAVECDADSLEIAVDSARQARSERDTGEAGRQLGIALSIIEDAVADRVRRLRALALVARMAGALKPLPAFAPSSCRYWRLRALVATGSLAHELLLGPTARLLLRIHLLRAAFGVVRGLLRRSRRALQRSHSDERAWHQLEIGVDDFRVLDRQHLEAVLACLVSARIHPRIQVVLQRAH